MPRSLLIAVIVRFWPAVVVELAAGFAVYSVAVIDPGSLAFQLISVGPLAAAIFTLVRVGHPAAGLTVAVGFGLFRFGLVKAAGWLMAFSGLFLGLGIFVVAIIVDLLARAGLRFGKFAVAGPLVGGVYLAVSPFVEFRTMNPIDALGTLTPHALVGLVMGGGVVLGLELGEGVEGLIGRARSSFSREAAATATAPEAHERDGQA